MLRRAVRLLRPLAPAVALLEAGLAKLHSLFDPYTTPGGKELEAAQAKARAQKLKVCATVYMHACVHACVPARFVCARVCVRSHMRACAGCSAGCALAHWDGAVSVGQGSLPSKACSVSTARIR